MIELVFFALANASALRLEAAAGVSCPTPGAVRTVLTELGVDPPTRDATAAWSRRGGAIHLRVASSTGTASPLAPLERTFAPASCEDLTKLVAFAIERATAPLTATATAAEVAARPTRLRQPPANRFPALRAGDAPPPVSGLAADRAAVPNGALTAVPHAEGADTTSKPSAAPDHRSETHRPVGAVDGSGGSLARDRSREAAQRKGQSAPGVGALHGSGGSDTRDAPRRTEAGAAGAGVDRVPDESAARGQPRDAAYRPVASSPGVGALHGSGGSGTRDRSRDAARRPEERAEGAGVDRAAEEPAARDQPRAASARSGAAGAEVERGAVLGAGEIGERRAGAAAELSEEDAPIAPDAMPRGPAFALDVVAGPMLLVSSRIRSGGEAAAYLWYDRGPFGLALAAGFVAPETRAAGPAELTVFSLHAALGLAARVEVAAPVELGATAFALIEHVRGDSTGLIDPQAVRDVRFGGRGDLWAGVSVGPVELRAGAAARIFGGERTYRARPATDLVSIPGIEAQVFLAAGYGAPR